MKKYSLILGFIASAICIIGGIVTILATLRHIDEDLIWLGVGIYFIGKGVFVGPMLIINAEDQKVIIVDPETVKK
jgi:hypothetical protein